MKSYKTYVTLLFTLFLSWYGSGQSIYEDEIHTYLSQIKKDKNLKSEIEFVISDEVINKDLGLTHIYVQHTINGLPIIGAISGFHFDRNARIEYVTLRLPKANHAIRKRSKKIESEYDALKITADILALDATFKLEKSNKIGANDNAYQAPKLSSEEIFLRRALLELENEYIPVWEVGIYDDRQHKWQVLRLDMASAEEVQRDSWTQECFSHVSANVHKEVSEKSGATPPSNSAMCDSTYNVIAYPLIAPNEGPQSLVSSPWAAAPVASPIGWHDTTYLRGNNVLANEDIDDNNTGGYSFDGGASLCFDAVFNDTAEVIHNLDASLTNAFYWNNLIHDVMYGYGFDEVSGNFQQSNFERGGNDLDRVTVDLLDGSGSNNANFSTPPDGFSARMQMFEWIPTVGNILAIKQTDSTSIIYDMLPALFGPHHTTVSDTVILSDPILACDPILNDSSLYGQIAMVDRGDCDFVSKALFIQKAGAIALIVCNNDTTDIFKMGGEDSDSITIPSVMLGKADCDSIKVQLANAIVEATITIPPTYDSGLDNGILVHEYAHGISTRLTGGPSAASCLSGNEQMGEGWSDWYALMFTLDNSDLPEAPVGIGTYVLGQNASDSGIRNFPYSTDLIVNPVTYDDIQEFSVPHGVGTVWASMLWDMTWNLIDQHGFDPDIYNGSGGNNRALRLVTLGLKLQPCDPGFVDGRDAILAADEILYDGVNACAIWKAFARRGLGIHAHQGSSNSKTDGSEDFTLPDLCTTPLLFSSSTAGIAYVSDTLSVLFDLRTNSLTIDTALICGYLPSEINYYAGDYTSLSNDTITFFETEMDSNQFVRNNIQVTLSPNDSSSIYYLERVEGIPSSWTMGSDTGSQEWEISDTLPYADSLSFFCKNVEGEQTQFLISPNFKIEGPTILGFWHYYNLEENWDGAFVELSIDNGQSWEDIGINALSNGYNDILKISSNPFSEGRFAYTGTNQEYQQTIIDLSPYDGSTIQIRFVLASDRYAFEEGWYIDNISLYHKYEIDILAHLTTSDYQILHDSTSIVILPLCEPCSKDLCDALIQSISVIDKDVNKAFQYIESDALLSLTDDVSFLAGDSILLLQNFTVPNQATFRAIIDQCIEP